MVEEKKEWNSIGHQREDRNFHFNRIKTSLAPTEFVLISDETHFAVQFSGKRVQRTGTIYVTHLFFTFLLRLLRSQ